jgi:hypothetical protein
MLKNLSITDDSLRAELEASDEAETFADFDRDDWSNFDWALQSVSTVLDEWLREHPHNAAIAGDRTIPGTEMSYGPMENLDLCFIATTDGTVEGYIWTYDLRGQRSLSLATSYSEYKSMRPESNGIEGCIEMGQYIITLANAAISDANEFFGGTR